MIAYLCGHYLYTSEGGRHSLLFVYQRLLKRLVIVGLPAFVN